MDNISIILSIFGALGIGAGVWNIIERMINYKLEKKKILFEKKFQAFSELSENILGLAIHKEDRIINPFENQAASAKARLLISDKNLNNKIYKFFVTLDDFVTGKKEGDKDFAQLQKEGIELVNDLNKDLKNTINLK